ncbi:MAG: histidinol dehydrogenase [Akkermansia sp.]|nr:histidinol dehydrogenase [Akkermansia sp.]
MNIYREPARETWPELCRRAEQDNSSIAETVARIVDRVARGGDAAVRELTLQIDGAAPEALAVGEVEFAAAEAAVSTELKDAIAKAAENIRAFHAAQMPREVRVETAPGVLCVQRPVPIQRVGLYIPGGTAPLFSTVLMLAVPALTAGCPKVILCTPPNKQGSVAPAVLYAAAACGLRRVFKVGGAQAIAAMAYGTESIPKVDKIFGPGNRYVTMAKQLVSGRNTAIDMPAGPSEVMVLADDTARPEFVAADLLSQAEHGRDSQAIAVCSSQALAEAVLAQVEAQAALLARADFVQHSLANSRIVVLADRAAMLDFANTYAAEHLIISLRKAEEAASLITAAGSVFIGNYTPESAGDYASGTNHTLPTCGWTAAYSGVNIDSFMRKMTLQHITREGLAALAPTITTMAEAEGLQAHANAVTVRLSQISAQS